MNDVKCDGFARTGDNEKVSCSGGFCSYYRPKNPDVSCLEKFDLNITAATVRDQAHLGAGEALVVCT